MRREKDKAPAYPWRDAATFRDKKDKKKRENRKKFRFKMLAHPYSPSSFPSHLSGDEKGQGCSGRRAKRSSDRIEFVYLFMIILFWGSLYSPLRAQWFVCFPNVFVM
ncbi:hypothetical protein TNCT_594411 [Trichonephila clavata]|uniref:Uncharacterized protein n=1 Tax=Trichonephila clavata TaxID=2740835 RepID=A0A8X6JIX9_TRICU|nr:hypothetical protein TNCT_594411 [Trichonephila clavata]